MKFWIIWKCYLKRIAFRNWWKIWSIYRRKSRKTFTTGENLSKRRLTGTTSVGIDTRDLFDVYSENKQECNDWPQIDIRSLSISQSIEVSLNSSNNLTLSSSLSSHNGRGNRIFATSFRHVISDKTWAELEVKDWSSQLSVTNLSPIVSHYFISVHSRFVPDFWVNFVIV